MMIKTKQILFIAVLLFAVSITASAFATELVSISELRQQTVNEWQEDIVSIRDEMVHIDTKILIPATETFPVALCEYDVLDENAYTNSIVLQEAIDPSRGTIMLLKEDVDGLIYYERRPLQTDGQAVNSTITSNDAFHIALNLIHQCNPSADFVDAGVLAYGCAYKTRSDLTNDYYNTVERAADVLDYDMPLDNKGLYRIWLLPALDGIPIHDANIPKSYASIQDESNFFIYYQPYRLNGYIIGDIPLCPWSVIQETIRGEVKAGRLREVYSIRLCFMEMFQSNDQYANWHRNHDFTRVAAPMWVVHGEIYDSAKSEPNATDAARREWPDFMIEQRVLQESSQFILIHPQTGEVLGSEFQNGKLNPKAVVVPPYTHWNEVNK